MTRDYNTQLSLVQTWSQYSPLIGQEDGAEAQLPLPQVSDLEDADQADFHRDLSWKQQPQGMI